MFVGLFFILLAGQHAARGQLSAPGGALLQSLLMAEKNGDFGSTLQNMRQAYLRARIIRVVRNMLDDVSDKHKDEYIQQHESCNGTRQSPINIQCRNLQKDRELKPLVFLNYEKAVDTMLMVNDGHTVRVTVPPTAGIRLLSDTLPATYRLAQFHFHWGTGDHGGSEHTINGKRWPLELHLVHINENIPFDDVNSNKEGLVVVSILFESVGVIDSILFGNNKTPMDGIEALSAAATKVTNVGTNTTLTNFIIGRLLPEEHTKNYLLYSGSLTTPPCSEVVEWIILTRTMAARSRHLRRFRSIRGHQDERVTENARPLKPLNDRPIHLLGDLGKNIPQC